jgi:large subunit ribosomal protein L35
MPKVKTNRAAMKRFRKTKNGGFKRNKLGKRHLMTAKSPKRRRQLKQATQVAEPEMKKLQKMLPYA